MIKRKEMKLATEKILKKKGVNYSEWRNEVINKKKLEIMSDKDKEWTDKTLDDASLELIMQNMESVQENQSSLNNHNN